MKFLVLAAALSVAAASAQGATVDQGSTLANDAGGINAAGSDVSYAVPSSPYFNGSTTPASEWVWVGTGSTATFEFEFDMTGFDLSSASLSGLWGVDNNGTVSLNGNLLASLTGSSVGNFQGLHSYGTNDASFFNAAGNTLTFVLEDTGPPAAFRATATVTANAAPVPLPASGLLLLAGISALAWRRRA